MGEIAYTGADSGKGCKIYITVQKLSKCKDEKKIKEMAEEIKEKCAGKTAAEIKEVLKKDVKGIEKLPEAEMEALVADLASTVGVSGATEEMSKGKKYPECTIEAQEECKKVVQIANGIKNNDSNPVISVFTHEDKTVSVGISGNGPKTAKFAEELQKALDASEPGKYRVCGSTDEELMTMMEDADRGVPGNPLGQCAEPKAASAASKSNSPITGMDTRWRLGDAPEKYQYNASDKSQMAPCDTCKEYEDIYMEYASKNK